MHTLMFDYDAHEVGKTSTDQWYNRTDKSVPTCGLEQDFFELHVISTNKAEQSAMLKAAKDIWPYVHYIHIREKQLSQQECFNWAKLMAEAGVPASRIVINGANLYSSGHFYQGVHWSQDMLERAKVMVTPENKHDLRLRLGISVHSLHEARIAEEYGADYLFFGHVYASASKPDSVARGLDALSEVCSSVKVPVIAIGGIQPDNIRAVRSAGARGAAVISSVLKHANPAHAAALLKQAVEAVK
ncbi:thiamine phosphate synthase [Paenibacillus polysaccharolyticus]|uniref:thiamine phosphate synthase n=1 Tax=Paenibacillus polysaccharolyticus TaxID=582692 RepID=UPI00209EF774|nr:thiamine phosphate synthase [Paenibacillus polysaccharolyticus]MCP1133446.1 thiamine phosphate synthase [Paenibacillus polysaccharolyticus]